DFNRAAALRDLLCRETGAAYRIERIGEGFVIARAGNPNALEDTPRSSRARQFEPIVLRPALRTSLPQYLPLLLLGVYLTAFPASAVSYLFDALAGMPFPGRIGPYWFIEASRLIGLGLIVFPALPVFVPWLASRYAITPEGITMRRGIVARDAVQIRYCDIRSIGLRQGILERLLNVGTLEFAAAGTDTVDIRFAGIARPASVRAFIERVMDEGRRDR
ncbi:MAG: PH domain-containing protein, partial [Rhodobacteraceae bacterium]|nr:PH domain-containing protein [Paracoccaceae bacterium]